MTKFQSGFRAERSTNDNLVRLETLAAMLLSNENM